MTAQRGKDLLIKIGDGADPEVFTTVAGLRATSLDFNAQTIDVTNSDSAEMWRELLADGVKSATVAGSGVFKDAASDAALKNAFFNQTLNNWQIAIPIFVRKSMRRWARRRGPECHLERKHLTRRRAAGREECQSSATARLRVRITAVV